MNIKNFRLLNFFNIEDKREQRLFNKLLKIISNANEEEIIKEKLETLSLNSPILNEAIVLIDWDNLEEYEADLKSIFLANSISNITYKKIKDSFLNLHDLFVRQTNMHDIKSLSNLIISEIQNFLKRFKNPLWELEKCIYQNLTFKKMISISEVKNIVNKDYDITMLEKLLNDESPFWDKENGYLLLKTITLEEFLDSLEENPKRIVIDYVLKDISVEDIAIREKITKERVRQILHNSLNKKIVLKGEKEILDQILAHITMKKEMNISILNNALEKIIIWKNSINMNQILNSYFLYEIQRYLDNGYIFIDEEEHYLLNLEGNLYKVSYKKRTIKPIEKNIHTNNHGVSYYQVSVSGKSRVYLHKIIAENFLENPFNYKYISFRDANTLNYHLDNLMWIKRPSDRRFFNDFLQKESNLRILISELKEFSKDKDITISKIFIDHLLKKYPDKDNTYITWYNLIKNHSNLFGSQKIFILERVSSDTSDSFYLTLNPDKLEEIEEFLISNNITN